MPSEREREWLTEWEESRDSRAGKDSARELRYQVEPAYRLLDTFQPIRQLFLVLKCHVYYWDDDFDQVDVGQLIRAFTSFSSARDFRDSLPNRGEWEEMHEHSGTFRHKIHKVPLGLEEVERMENGGKGQEVRIAKAHLVVGDRPGEEDWVCPLAAFQDPNEAEAFKEQCCQAYRAHQNPLGWSFLNRATSMPEEVFRDWLLDLDLEPPPLRIPGKEEWRRWQDWWEANCASFAAWQRVSIWQVMDRIVMPYRVLDVDCG